MIRLMVPATALALIWCQPALAQQGHVSGAEMLWYGVFQIGQSIEVRDDKAAGGTRTENAGITPPRQNGDRIPRVANTSFGVGFKLAGTPSNAVVSVKFVRKYPLPGIPNEAAGQATLRSERTINYRINEPDLNVGYTFGPDAAALTKLPLGRWTFQVWHQDRMLLEKTFTVYQP